MITSAFLYLIFSFVWVLTSPLRLVGDVALPAALTGAIATAGVYMTSVEPYFPLPTLFAMLAFVLTVEAAIGLYKGIMWIVRRIPTQS